MSNNGRMISIVSFVITAAAFLILSSIAIVWAGGLSFDLKNRKVSQSGIISVGETLKTAQIYLNGSLVASETPHDIRGLIAGDYNLEVIKDGYQVCERNYQLSEGEAITVKPAMVATAPLTTELSPTDAPNYLDRLNYDFGISVLNGELLDYGGLVSRFSTDPIQVHRFNDYYTYQSGTQLHFLDLGCGTDQVIYTSVSGDKIQYVQRISNWVIYVYEGSVVKRLNLRESSAASASL